MEQPQRDNIDVLLTLARRLQKENNYSGASDVYKMALERMPKGDPRRTSIEGIIHTFERQDLPRPPETEPETRPTRRSGINPAWIVVALAGLLAVALPVFLVLVYGQTFAQSPAPVSALLPSPTSAGGNFPRPTLVTPSPLGAPAAAKTPTPARSSVAFQDNFATLDPFKWVAKNTDNTTVDTSAGVLHLASSSGHFPYIYTPVNPIPTTGNFRVTARYRYTQVGVCGAPIVLASFRLPEGLSHDETNRVSQSAEAGGGLSIWIWYNVLYYRQGATSENIPVSNSTGAWHIATIDYSGNVYRISIDGASVFSSPPTAVRPQLIWIGNPFELGSNCQWDTLDLSTVLVEQMP